MAKRRGKSVKKQNAKKQNTSKVNKEVKKNLTFLQKAEDYYINEYKKLLLIPVGLFVLSMIILLVTYSTTGDFIRRDVSLKGGISLTINTDYNDIAGFENHLNTNFPEGSINIRTIESGGKLNGIIIEASDVDEDLLLDAVNEKIILTKENYSLETMGSTLGQSFFIQMFWSLILAFIFMGLVFQFYFKNWYATGAALFSAFMDIFITLGLMNLFNVRLTAGGIAAYLMLIGYSIDTSILISTKLLIEKNELRTGIFNAMKTGLTMSAAGIAATGISFLFTNNNTLKQIMLILIVGLFIDIITTWIGNLAFLRMHLEKNGKA
ncbi:hypothetical protein HOC35_00440 [Candidatus Woesearchaeota archaeon]|mgnify:CR=1 FL=1|jgi:preprotein translocase subunit SecF|nr:hypothetical protein [Candidatus Woesearchaeota archaeon]